MARFLCMMVGFKFAEEIQKHHVMHVIMGSLGKHLEGATKEMEKEMKKQMKKEAAEKN